MPDLQVENHGSIFLFRPMSEAGREWLEEHTAAEPWQWLGDALAVEHRYAEDLANGAIEEGLTVV